MITSTKNPRIVETRKLTERKYRRQQNRFLVEGLQLLSLAVEAMAEQGQYSASISHLGWDSGGASRPVETRIKPLELFYCRNLFTGATAPRLLAQLIHAGAEAIPVALQVMDTLSERDLSQGLAATFALSNLEMSLDELLSTPSSSTSRRLILILDKLQDPGNLGTLIRTADAVGAQAVILLEPSVDPFDPKTVRGTMGSLFTVPFTRVKDMAEVAAWLNGAGYRLVGADGCQGDLPWQSNAFSGSVALVLGNEARGLSQELRPYIEAYVRLPLRGHAESLNVSVAGGALMYEWLRLGDL